MNRPSQLDWQDLEFDSRSAGDVHTLISEIGPNPWLTLGIMDQIEDESLLAEWDAGLDHQTRMLAPREISWMRQHGLGDGASGILEVGSANGNYGAALARSLPDRRVYGLDSPTRRQGRVGSWSSRVRPASARPVCWRTPAGAAEDPAGGC